MLKSIFYVSARTAAGPGDGAQVDAIMRTARARNAALGITGALIATPSHFAQLIEGPAAAIDAVFASILADPRYRDVRVLEATHRERRLFPDWTLAYAGHASFVGGRVQRCLEGKGASRPDTHELLELMRGFALTV